MSSLVTEFHMASFVSQMVLIGLGSGMLQPPANSIIFSSASHRNLGMVSSLTAVVRIHSRSLGIAVLGGVWVFLTRSWLASNPDARNPLVEATAQIESFGLVCMIASLILGSIGLVCLVETVLYYHRRRNVPAAG